MMGRSIVAILFDNTTENIFYTGQPISGRVHVETSDSFKIRGIRLEIFGSAYVSWTEGSGDDQRKYSGSEELVNFYIDLMGSRSKDSELNLQQGTYDLPFTFILTPELPSSFEGIHGHIRYGAKAVIDRPLRFDDTAEVSLTVVHLLDLNNELPQFREPIVLYNHSHSTGCCFCCVSGFAEIDVNLNKGLFVVGETIAVQGQISNRSNTKIKRSIIGLYQNIEFRVVTKSGKIYRTKNVRKVLQRYERPAVAQGHTDSWNDLIFVVPAVPSSRLDGCKLINITYFVEVSAVYHECCSNSTAQSEIIIGNIPLTSDIPLSAITVQPEPQITGNLHGFASGQPFPPNSDFKHGNNWNTFTDVYKT